MVSRERLLQLTVLTATALEERAVRAAAPTVNVVRTGVGLQTHRKRLRVAISCGLAGGLRADLPTGTVLVPTSVGLEDGRSINCDPELQNALIAAARCIGAEAVTIPLLTAGSMVSGGDRRVWAARGYGGVDMETGLISAERLGCVRVVLDTPSREISPLWLQPLRAMLRPSVWRDLPFLMREGPRCASLAGRVVAAAFDPDFFAAGDNVPRTAE